MCLGRGVVNDGSRRPDGTLAPPRRRFLVCDHVVPHKGDEVRFWTGPFQTLCPDHHDRRKQSEERAGFSLEAGLDGWPVDPGHPANR